MLFACLRLCFESPCTCAVSLLVPNALPNDFYAHALCLLAFILEIPCTYIIILLSLFAYMAVVFFYLQCSNLCFNPGASDGVLVHNQRWYSVWAVLPLSLFQQG